MELEEAIEGLNSLKIIFEIDNGANFEATPVTQKEIANEIKVVLNHLTKQEKMIQNLKKTMENDALSYVETQFVLDLIEESE